MSREKRSNQDIQNILSRMVSKGSLKYRVASKSWTYMGQAVTPGNLSRILAHKLEVSPNRLLNALDGEGFKRQADAYTMLRRWLCTSDEQPRDDQALRRWLKMLEREDTTPTAHEANVVAVKQWMWGVKRSVAEKKVRWPVAPIFWSRENGTGKSTNVIRLLKPLTDFVKHVSATELGSRFSGAMFANTIIAFIDEFAGVDKVCTAGFKAILGGKPIDQRAMYSEAGIFCENHLSVLATSNERPPHGFVDHTGGRRFWSIHCLGAAVVEGSERALALDSVDVEAIWAAVGTDDLCPHETAPPAIRAFMDAVREEHLRTRTSLENFVDEGTEWCDQTVKLPMKDFLAAYLKYCTESRQRAIGGSHKKVGEQLKNLGQTVVCTGNKVYIRGRVIISFEAV